MNKILLAIVVTAILIITSIIISILAYTKTNTSSDGGNVTDKTLLLNTGTPEIPSIGFFTPESLNTGIYLSAEDTISFSRDAQENVRFTNKEIMIDNLNNLTAGTPLNFKIDGITKASLSSNTLQVPNGISASTPGLQFAGGAGLYDTNDVLYFTSDGTTTNMNLTSTTLNTPSIVNFTNSSTNNSISMEYSYSIDTSNFATSNFTITTDNGSNKIIQFENGNTNTSYYTYRHRYFNQFQGNNGEPPFEMTWNAPGSSTPDLILKNLGTEFGRYQNGGQVQFNNLKVEDAFILPYVNDVNDITTPVGSMFVHSQDNVYLRNDLGWRGFLYDGGAITTFTATGTINTAALVVSGTADFTGLVRLNSDDKTLYFSRSGTINDDMIGLKITNTSVQSNATSSIELYCGDKNCYIRLYANDIGMQFQNSNVNIVKALTVGSPTGGFTNGDGTINAEAIYDDNTIVSDFVFEAYYTGNGFDQEHKDYQVPTIQENIQHTQTKYHLKTMPSREEYKQQRASLGTLTSKLWETTEVNFLYIAQHQQTIKQLQQKVLQLEQQIQHLNSQ